MKKAERKRSVIVLSLHPEWWERMKAGDKLLEIRKTRPRGSSPYEVMVYITGGVGVVGEFACDCFYKIEAVPQIGPWALPEDESGIPYNLEAASCLTRQQLKEYAGEDGKPLWGWHVTDCREYSRTITLADLGIKKPPQSWCYAKIGGAA